MPTPRRRHRRSGNPPFALVFILIPRVVARDQPPQVNKVFPGEFPAKQMKYTGFGSFCTRRAGCHDPQKTPAG
jgi:hypothetical protein